jgi:UDP-glucose 4-epimerase
MPLVPRVLGFDARLQFLHPSDAVEALLRVTREDIPGTFNVAADDVVTLTQALRKLGRPTLGVPHSLAPSVAGLVRQARLSDFSADQIDALTYGRAMDTSRFAEATQTGTAGSFRPRYSSREALEEFVEVSQPGLLAPQRIESALDGIGALLSTRRDIGASRG